VSAGTWIAVAALGGGAAVARFGLDAAVSGWAGRELPFGTFAVNVAGAFALGVLAGTGAGADAVRLAGTATLGSFTTFSTWLLESRHLGEDGRSGAMWLNLLVSLAAGLGAVAAGRALGRAL
jgi:CrcB protein